MTPHPAAVEIQRWTLDGFGELRGLRAALREAVTAASGADPDDLLERMAIVTTELATNALRHGLPPTVVRLLSERDLLIIDVADHDRDATPLQAGDRPPGHGGLGLRLARSFAAEIGWYTTDDTKNVWASFPG